MKKITSKNFNKVMTQMIITSEIPQFLKSLCEGVVISNTKVKPKTLLLGTAEWKCKPNGISMTCELDMPPNIELKKLHMLTVDEKYHLVFNVGTDFNSADPMYLKLNNELEFMSACNIKCSITFGAL